MKWLQHSAMLTLGVDARGHLGRRISRRSSLSDASLLAASRTDHVGSFLRMSFKPTTDPELTVGARRVARSGGGAA